uniref:Bestrophin homolog n=1 Tax=Strongyloides venezuelensis TaxID=75913 RepID=A0A0K0FVE9_STRVS
MTIWYEEEFSSLLLRWRGSLWKAVLKDLMAFYVGYYIILFSQWYFLDEEGKEYFTGWIEWCEIGLQYIPLSFLLGFFVAVIVARWWEQFNWISWPDKMMIMVSACLPGPENLVIRQTIARWSSLQAAIAWSGISVRTLKRFPTERHLVDSGLMTEEEHKMYTELDSPHGKWFVPIIWIVNILKRAYQQGRIDSIQFDMILKHVYSYRDGFAMLFVYDWIKIPLVYTQVVAIATYGYFFICLIGRQPKINQSGMKNEVTIMFPIFTTFQMLFYLGWLKVGQYLMNPFGEDDDDFELNYILDRNTAIAHVMATELADQLPPLSEAAMNPNIPHTRASFKIQDIMPKNHLSGFQLTNREMEMVTAKHLDGTETQLPKDKSNKFWRKSLNKAKRGNKDAPEIGNTSETEELTK